MRHSIRLWGAKASSTSSSLSAKHILETLHQRRTEAFFGLPHGTLQPLLAYARYHSSPHDYALCTSAEQLVGLAAGHCMATGKTACLCADEDALLDLAGPLHRFGVDQTATRTADGVDGATLKTSPSLSCVMLLGCRRGPRGARRTPQILESLGIPFQRVDGAALASSSSAWESTVEAAFTHLHGRTTRAYAILLDTDVLDAYRSADDSAVSPIEGLTLSLTTVAEQIARQVNAGDIVVCAEGPLTRPLLTARAAAGHVRDGAAPHTHIVPTGADVASVAAGVALAAPETRVYGVQTDADAVAHLGAFAVQAPLAATNAIAPTAAGPLSNLCHLVVSSGAYLSRDGLCSTGLPTPAFDASIAGVAKACGCALVREEPVLDVGELVSALGDMRQTEGPCLLEVVVAAPALKSVAPKG